MELTWHGHSTVAVTVGETDFLIDPFFDNPFTSVDPNTLNPDHVLLTHGHADHIADVGAFADTHVLGTPEVTAYVEDEYGVSESTGMNLGGTVQLGDAYVTMHRADHTNGLDMNYDVSGGMPAGFILSDTKPTQIGDTESQTLYHAGDTGLMTEMRDVIGPFLEPDIAALPIGDHFTMGPQQAAIATDWLEVDHVLPIHYDTFPPIEVDPKEFQREVRATGSDAAVHLLEGDERISLAGL